MPPHGILGGQVLNAFRADFGEISLAVMKYEVVTFAANCYATNYDFLLD